MGFGGGLGVRVAAPDPLPAPAAPASPAPRARLGWEICEWTRRVKRGEMPADRRLAWGDDYAAGRVTSKRLPPPARGW